MTATTNIETEAFVVDSPNAPFKLTPIILDEMRENEFLIEMIDLRQLGPCLASKPASRLVRPARHLWARRSWHR
jgi:hypothetical protein